MKTIPFDQVRARIETKLDRLQETLDGHTGQLLRMERGISYHVENLASDIRVRLNAAERIRLAKLITP